MAGIGVYPGSFNPPTRAHIEIAAAALAAHQLDRVDLAISRVALGKHATGRPTFDERVRVVEESVALIAGLGVVVTEHQLLAEIAGGYDVVVMGADKWAQIAEPRWYANAAARDEALAALPTLAIAPRPPYVSPPEHRLDVPDDLLEVSSSEVRAGRVEWMTEAAREFQQRTGAWRVDRPPE